MQELILNNNSKGVTIKSTELVEIINQFRTLEGNRKELEHKDFMKKIRKELETLKSLGLINEGNISPVEYTDAKGESRPCYELNRDGMLQMLNSESALVRYKTIEYINKLEDKQPQFNLPTTYKEALLQLVQAEEEKEQLLLEKQNLEYTNNILTHTNKTYTTTEIAKELNLNSARELNRRLCKDKIQFIQNGTYVLYSDCANKGYTSIKQTVLDDDRIVYNTRWTDLGREFILKKYSQVGFEV